MKTVLITGASSGIGKSIGEFLHQKGYLVVGTSRNPNQYPASVFPLLSLDVRSPELIRACISHCIEKYGRIDVLINNAGVGITGPMEEIPIEEIKKHFDTNFFGPVEVMKAVLPYMRSRKSGYIVNITSIAGYMGLPYRSFYSAGKGALELISEGLSMEVKPFGINIVCVAPGDFATNIAAGRYHAPVLSDSPYTHYITTLEAMNTDVNTGNSPEVMAHAVYKIINTKNPRLHYKVGSFLQRFSIFLKAVLPDRLYEKMLMRHYKL